MAYTNILVASDFHDDCLPVIKKAIEIKALNQAKLSLVTVVPNVPYYMASGLSSISDVEEQLEDESQAKLNEVKTELDLDCKTYLLHGSPKIEISKLAKEIKADLIVIGSHGKHGVQLLLGSTSSGVLHRAKCDVMVVRTSKYAPSKK